MKVLLIIVCMFLSSLANASCVILLHGLARTVSSMDAMEDVLSDSGYHVVNLGYPSRNFDIETLSEKAIVPAIERCKDGEDINFVTHSLGGILVRQYLTSREIKHLNYVVMLGPPNKGSEVVDKLHAVPGFKFLNGDAGMQLGTGELSIPNSLGPANFNVGIIAGNKSINWILSALIPGSDDGKVSIESTKLEGMNDHVVMSVSHPFLMKNKRVISQVLYYLKNGKFEKSIDL